MNNVNEPCICRLCSTQLKNKIKLGIKEKFFGRFLLARISQRQVTNGDINAEHVLVRARRCAWTMMPVVLVSVSTCVNGAHVYVVGVSIVRPSWIILKSFSLLKSDISSCFCYSFFLFFSFSFFLSTLKLYNISTLQSLCPYIIKLDCIVIGRYY